MTLNKLLPTIMQSVENQQGFFSHNHTLYRIHEGALLDYVLEKIKEQVNEKAFKQIAQRPVPINVLKRLVDKLSKIYVRGPKRSIESLEESSDENMLLSKWEKALSINTKLALANRYFNLQKGTFIEPYLDRGKPKLRALPFDRFSVYSNDPVEPLRVTHLVKTMGEHVFINGERRLYFYVYSDDEFLICDAKGAVIPELMAKHGSDGINEYGRIPGVYVHRSSTDLIPEIDTDTLSMTLLFPILLSDLSFAVMYQSFSIVYGIDIDMSNLFMSPNAVWDIKSDKDNEGKTPQVGTIKPTVDIDAVVRFVITLLSTWMQTRNIRPGAGIGNVTTENFASGIAKAIDEMDTSEDRMEQIPFFVDAETELWELLINHMMPVWENDEDFRKQDLQVIPFGNKVAIQFPEQQAILDESTKLDNMKKKKDMGIVTKRDLVKEYNPTFSSEQIEQKVKDLKEEENTQNTEGLV